MFRPIARHLVVMFAVFALLGGTTLQAVAFPGMARQGAAAMTTTSGTPCASMKMTTQAQKHGAPCKGITPDCVKQMGCASVPALPQRAAEAEAPAFYAKVAYSAQASLRTGRSVAPPVFPPIAS